jgi:hypothetical protein
MRYIIILLLHEEGFIIHYCAHEKNTHWHHENIPSHKEEGTNWQNRKVQNSGLGINQRRSEC